MADLSRGRLLALGLVAALAVVGLSAGVAALTAWFDWKGVAISGLMLICLLVLLQTVRPGSQMPGFAGGREVYIELAGRQASQDGLSHHRPSTVHATGLWALLPPVATLIIIAIVF